MIRKLAWGACVAVLVLSFSGMSFAVDQPHAAQGVDQGAVTAAYAWLASVDKAQYEQSWEDAGAYFKSMVTKEQWVMQVAAVRKAFGNFVSRVTKDSKSTPVLPGAPDGNYCIFTFEAVFTAKAAAVETLTMMQDKDGQWRMVGYFIK